MARSHLIIRHYQSYIKETLEENERTKNKKPMGLFAYFLFFLLYSFLGVCFLDASIGMTIKHEKKQQLNYLGFW